MCEAERLSLVIVCDDGGTELSDLVNQASALATRWRLEVVIVLHGSHAVNLEAIARCADDVFIRLVKSECELTWSSLEQLGLSRARGSSFVVGSRCRSSEAVREMERVAASFPVDARRVFSWNPFWRTFSSRRRTLRARRRVLLCTHNLQAQGAQRSLYELALGLIRLGYELLVASPVDGPFHRCFLEVGIEVCVVGSPSVSSVSAWESQVERLARGVAWAGIDVVLANTLVSWYWIHVARMADVKSILVPREGEPSSTYFDDLPVNLRPLGYRAVEAADRVIFVSEATRAEWEDGRRLRQSFTVPNSLDPAQLERVGSQYSRSEARASLGVSESEIVILNVGTISPRKGQMDLLAALPRVARRGIVGSIRCMLVGAVASGEITSDLSRYNQTVQACMRQSGAVKYCVFEEGDNVPVAAYLAADIFVLCSRYESYPRSLLEAMYFGLPVIATRCSGVTEQCLDGENALFYEGGFVQELEDRLVEIVGNPELRSALASRSRARWEQINNYRWMVSRYAQEIDAIAG